MFRKIAVFIFFFCFGFGYQLNPFKQTIHIYIDFATTPTLLQMMDIVQQPAKDKKFIFFRRFPNLSSRIDLTKYGAVQIDLPISEYANHHSNIIIENAIQTIYENHINADYIIHSNLWWNKNLIPILKIIPKRKIKQLHLYEDGVSNIVYSRKKETLSVNPEKINYKSDLESILSDEKIYNHNYNFAFHLLYPTTYYFSFIDYAKQHPEFDTFMSFLSGATLKEIDWFKFATILTDEQKSAIYHLTEFDINHYKEQIKDKSTDFFLLRGAFSSPEEQIKTTASLFKNQDKDRLLILKEHPSLSIQTMAHKIQQNIPNAVMFPKHIPFEVLILADLMPDTVSGYTSSVFFSIPAEKIKYFITTDKDFYLPFLKELNIVSDEKVIKSMKEEND